MKLTYDENELPFLTAELPGIGGRTKRFNEDFLVEEIPLYLASGEGTHVYFTIEKGGMTTPAAIERIARALGRHPREIGYAGLKDAHGVTRQQLSLEHIDPDRVRKLGWDRLRVLDVARHTNKLKLGHLSGNRFDLRVREFAGSQSEADASAQAILSELTRRGVPNYFGAQRFGARGDNALIGRAAIIGDLAEAIGWVVGRPGPEDRGDVRVARELYDAGDFDSAARTWPNAFRDQIRICRTLVRRAGDYRGAWKSIPANLRRLFLSALQSALFNRVLAQRIFELDRLEAGDMAWKHANGACFRVIDPAQEQPRCVALEISPTGPLFGKRMTPTEGKAGEMESAVLSEAGLDVEQMRHPPPGDSMDGARRPLRVPMKNVQSNTGSDDRGPYVQVRFELPPGAYATVVTRELCKSEDAD
ncbi:MAG: tRNA pseudouridine(13) synthase TruD [Phycisphaerae bacterium]|nr:tRNA pseudouridine(13) synthase TruD [Phycisphaerae bacterium]